MAKVLSGVLLYTMIFGGLGEDSAECVTAGSSIAEELEGSVRVPTMSER